MIFQSQGGSLRKMWNKFTRNGKNERMYRYYYVTNMT